MKPLKNILISTLLLSSLAYTANITSWKANYSSGSDIWIEIEDKPNNNQDWVGIYPAGSTNDWDNVVTWKWAKYTSPTQVDQGDWYKFQLDDGNYEARFFLNNSFTLNDKVSFSVGKQKLPTLTLVKKNYKEKENITVKLSNLPANNGDWVGIYSKGSSNDWANVVRWSYTNGTPSMNHEGIRNGTITLEGIDAGEYEARLFYDNSYRLEKKVGFSVEENNNNNTVAIGAREVNATPRNQGKLFASPNGQGDCMSYGNACDIYTAIGKLSQTNNVLFLRGGVYHLNKRIYFDSHKKGTEEIPLVIESIDSENKAVLIGNLKHDALKIYQTEYLHFRNIEIKEFNGFGIRIRESNHIRVEGCSVHDNKQSGISLYGSSDNIITDNYTYNNRGNQGNTDGIQIEIYNNKNLSKNNRIIHNTVHDNSDDGIDNIAGVDTTISYNITYNNEGVPAANGNGGGGNGLGIKACGAHANGAKVMHNIAFGNKGNGIECQNNIGADVVFAYNTSFDNKDYGFGLEIDSQVTLHHNISSDNTKRQVIYGQQSENSWEVAEKVPFISTNINSTNFLRPEAGSVFENMGAYAR